MLGGGTRSLLGNVGTSVFRLGRGGLGKPWMVGGFEKRRNKGDGGGGGGVCLGQLKGGGSNMNKPKSKTHTEEAILTTGEGKHSSPQIAKHMYLMIRR